MESDPSSVQPGSDASGDSSAGQNAKSADPPEPASIKSTIGELAEYVFYYLSAKFDLARLEVRRLLFWAGFWIIVLLVSAATAIVGTVFIFIGLADALAEVFHTRWIADLVTGALLLGSMGIAVFVVVTRIVAFSNAKMHARYEARRQRQLRNFGSHVHQRAEEHTPQENGKSS